jgi:ATP-dependent DNA helicase RecQ
MPSQHVVDEVLSVLESAGASTVAELEGMVNLRRGRLEALLKVLDVEGAVDRDGTSWLRTDRPWTYDTERYQQLAAARAAEQAAMREYQQLRTCRLRFLREQLDDPDATDCGRCDNCTGTSVTAEVAADATAAAQQFLRGAPVVIEPRKQWPRGLDGCSGNIPVDHRAQEGRALAFGNDPGWSEVVAGLFHRPDAPPDDDLVRGVAAALKAWPWAQRPTWVTWIPSRARPQLVQGLVERLAQLGKLTPVDAVRRVRADAPPQSQMENSATQAANVLGSFHVVVPPGGFPAGPGLLLDDSLRSGWTMTVVAEALLDAGADQVLPFVLWKRP